MIAELRKRVVAALTAGKGVELSADELRAITLLGFDTWLLTASQMEAASIRAQSPPLDKPVYTPAELADRWGVSLDAVRAAIHSGRLVAFKLGTKLYRVRRDEVERYEAGR